MWPVLVALLAAAGTYAGIMSSATEPLRGGQLAWALVAVASSAIFGFMTTMAGGYALGVWKAGRTDGRAEPAPPPRAEPVWGGVPPRNPHFTDRTDALDALDAALGAGHGSCSLVGLGGVGKTSVAAEFAHRAADRFGVVWWIRAESAATILADLTDLAARLHDDRAGPIDPTAVPALVQRGLARHGRWLLVFDNAEDYPLVRGHWPVGEGAVLVTSRSRLWDGLTDAVVELDVLAHDDAVALLRRRTRDPDDGAVAALAEQLGRLPLALAQAGAYVSRTGTTLRHYRTLIEEHTDSVLRAGQPGDYRESVGTTWAVSFEAAAAQAPDGGELLHLCAFLAPTAIPRWLLTRHADALPEPLRAVCANPVTFDLAVAAQSQYSLLSPAEDGLSMHRLVQLAVRASLPPQRQAAWVATAFALLERAVPADVQRVESWPECAELAPHVLAVAAHVQDAATAGGDAGRVLLRTGRYLTELGAFAPAADLLRMAVAALRQAVGPDDCELGVAYRCLALALYRQADLDPALEMVNRAIEIHRSGPEGPLIDDLVQLGRVRRELSQLPAALEALEDALARAERLVGPSGGRLAPVLRELGNTYRVAGRLRAARQALERAIAIGSAQEDANAGAIAGLHYILGAVCRDLGDLPAAERHLRAAITTYQRTHGDGSTPLLRAEQSLSDTLCAAGTSASIAEALEHAEHAVAGLTAAYGTADHPDVAEAMRSQGDALNAVGRPAEAAEVLRRAVDVYERRYGADHPYVALPLIPLAASLRLLDRADEAAATIERARTIVVARHGETHPLYARVLLEQSRQRAAAGDAEQARALATRAEDLLTAAVAG
jgi:tetratricopeptide (TPR) repeat protein